MKAKFAFISDTSPLEDFMFTLDISCDDDIQLICDDLNATLTGAHVEFVSKYNSRRNASGVSHN